MYPYDLFIRHGLYAERVGVAKVVLAGKGNTLKIRLAFHPGDAGVAVYPGIIAVGGENALDLRVHLTELYIVKLHI